MCRTRDVAVALPRKTDIHEHRRSEGERTDARGVAHDHVEQEGISNTARNESHDGDDLVGLKHDVWCDTCRFHLLQHGLPEEGAFLEHDEITILDVLQRDRLSCGEVAVLRYTADNLTASHWKQLQIRRCIGNDDDAEVQLVTFKLFADGDGSFLVQIDIEMRITALKAREDFRKEVGTHHRRNTDLDRALLELLVVVDFEHGILYVA